MIGENIYFLRKKRGLSLSQLAEKSNVSKSYLSNIERNINKNPSIQIVEKISLVLGVDVKLLIKGQMGEPQTVDAEWQNLIEELKKSKIKKEDLGEYKTLLEFIKWKNNQSEGRDTIKTIGMRGKDESFK